MSLQHYYNPGGHAAPSLLLSSNPSVGFSSISNSIVNGNPSCSFSRLTSMPSVPNYFSSDQKYYIITATGTVTSSGNYKLFLQTLYNEKYFN